MKAVETASLNKGWRLEILWLKALLSFCGKGTEIATKNVSSVWTVWTFVSLVLEANIHAVLDG